VYSKQELENIGDELSLGRAARFRDLVTLMTYGDDAKGSVRPGYDKFNHVSMANTLKANDMIFTMPDKESDPVPFMSRYDADFLKRKDRYDEDLGVFVGVLEEASIFKSLHSILESKEVTPLEVCTQNVDGALREWFFHGREKFEERRQQMKEIARRADLPCRTLDDDYDTRVADWKKKYVPQMGKVFDAEEWYTERIVGKSLKQVYVMLGSMLGNTNPDKHRNEKIRITRRAIHDFELDNFSVPDSIAISDSSSSQGTLAVGDEEILCSRVKEVLGKPWKEEYPVIDRGIACGDLLYVFEGVYLVIECKRVVGRHGSYMRKVREQAIKYAKVLEACQPTMTVYGLTYTEYGFELVECFGEPRFPAKIADFLDNVKIVS
jgi:hypothetical protein